jgi:hypothetical protein
MKNIFFFSIVIFFFNNCTPHAKERYIYDKQFKWRITIPENFEEVTIDEALELQKQGIDSLGKTIGTKVENHAKNIFDFKSGELNHFLSNYQPFDTLEDGNYLELCKAIDGVVYETFKTQMPGTKIDSITSVEVIDGLEFQSFKLKLIYPNKMVMNFILYTRLFGKKQFSCNIIYADIEKGNLMFSAWKNSKFEKD